MQGSTHRSSRIDSPSISAQSSTTQLGCVCPSQSKLKASLSVLSLFLLLFTMIPAFGQNTVGTIVGTVLTADGSSLAGATVTVTNEGTHSAQTLTSGAHGEYAAPALNPGNYTVMVTAPGFSTFTTTGIVVQSQQTVRTDIPLKIGEVGTQVVVTGGAPVIEAEMPSISTTVSSDELNYSSSNLLGTKDTSGNSGIEEFIATLPTGHSGQGSQWSMAGSTAGEDYYNVDGISSNSTLYGNADGPAFPSYDIVQEVKYDAVDNKAEFGQLVNITVITKSGTDHVHGSVFDHFGNQDLTAQSYFSKSNPAFTTNDFGGGIGGPIWRNKAYYAFSYEGYINNAPFAINASLPTAAFKDGDFTELLGQTAPLTNPYNGKQPFATANVIDPDLLTSSQSLAAQGWQNIFYPNIPGTDAPTNCGAAGALTSNYCESVSQSVYSNRYDARFDVNLTPKNSAFIRFSYNRASPETLDSGLSPSLTGTGYRIQVRKTFSGVISDTWIVTPNLINVFKVGAEWSNNNFHPILQGQAIADSLGINLPTVAPAGSTGFPALTIGGSLPGQGSITSPGQLGPANGTEQNNQVTDQITWQHASHTIKGGFEYRPQQGTQPYYPSFGNYSYNGSITGNAYADFLLGLPATTSYTYLRPSEYARQYFLSGFVQDDWRIRRNLMISYGLRYDFDNAPVDKYDTISNFDPATGSIVVPNPANKTGYNPNFDSYGVPVVSAASLGYPTRALKNSFKAGFFPRIGFAYNLNDKTVIRGAYGVYNNDLTIELNNYLYQAPYGGTISYTNPAPVAGQTYVPTVTFSNPFPSTGATGKLAALNINSIDKNVRNPYVQQWNLTIERDLGFSTGLRLSYIGSQTNQLLYGQDINQRPVSATAGTTGVYNPLPYGNLKVVRQEVNGGIQSYNAMTAEVTRHMRKGLLFEGAVTLAKNLTDDPSIGDAEGGILIEQTGNIGRQYGNEQYTPRWQFVSNLLYVLPIGHGQMFLNEDNLLTKIIGGWQLSAAYLANTGQYLTPTYSGDAPGIQSSLSSMVASKGTASSSSAVGGQSLTNWFNPAAYAKPAAGTFGNLKSGVLKGPDSQILDAALYKTFPIYHGTSIEISGSFTNVLNHPNFGNPDINISDSAVGHITSVQGYMYGPRAGLVSARIKF